MRKILLNLCTSLDSFIEGKNGEIDWCFTDQDYSMTAFLEGIDAILIGRKSYEQLQTLAPDAFNDKEFIIVSNSPISKTKNRRVLSGDIATDIQKIKESEGKNIWLFGGASLTSSLLQSELVDELIIAIHPLILGNGKSLFQNINKRIKLALYDTKTYSTGLVQLYYQVKYSGD